MKALTNLTQNRLKELLHYDAESGIFTRLTRAGREHIGSVAGRVPNIDGYKSIMLEGSRYQAHRLAWLYVTGAWPEGDIDHINGNKVDNMISNLRDVTRSVNMENQRRSRSDGSTGLLGVTMDPGGKARAQIMVQGRRKYLGLFKTPELAHAAYLDAKRIHHIGNTL